MLCYSKQIHNRLTSKVLKIVYILQIISPEFCFATSLLTSRIAYGKRIIFVWAYTLGYVNTESKNYIKFCYNGESLTALVSSTKQMVNISFVDNFRINTAKWSLTDEMESHRKYESDYQKTRFQS
jgi:hypothetical protein